VIGTGRNTARVTAPAGVTYLDLDVTSDESVASAVKQAIDRFGHIDVLVNNAGVGSTGAAEEFSIIQTQDIFAINVYGVMRTTKAVLPHMRTQGRGRSINVSSLSGFVPSPFMAIYVSTKHAVEGYSQSLDHEVRDHGIRVARGDQAVGVLRRLDAAVGRPAVRARGVPRERSGQRSPEADARVRRRNGSDGRSALAGPQDVRPRTARGSHRRWFKRIERTTHNNKAVEGYSGSLDNEVREHGVLILLVEPGGTLTLARAVFRV
jgi:NAD(P)-dependent dehydrogenase (short-subunit alcohol dehydrogenase family)